MGPNGPAICDRGNSVIGSCEIIAASMVVGRHRGAISRWRYHTICAMKIRVKNNHNAAAVPPDQTERAGQNGYHAAIFWVGFRPASVDLISCYGSELLYGPQ